MNSLKLVSYARLCTQIGAAKETKEIINSISELQKNISFEKFCISNDLCNKNSKKNVYGLPLGHIIPALIDRLDFLFPHGSRVVNEGLVDYLLYMSLNNEPCIILSSMLSFKSFSKNKANSGLNIFYAKNSFDFYSVVSSESRKWDVKPKKGEYKYLSKYNDIIDLIDCFIVLTEADSKYLIEQKGIPKHNILLPKMGVDASLFEDVFHTNIKKISTSKDTGCFIFGFMGGALLRKGLLYVLEAWNVINTSNKLIIAGISTNEIKYLENRYPNIKNVVFKGHVNNLDFFSEIDYYLSPSLAEGQARATLEAIASGVHVIATKRGASEVPNKFYYQISEDCIKDTLSQFFLSPPPFKKATIISARQYIMENRKFSDFGHEIASFVDKFIES